MTLQLLKQKRISCSKLACGKSDFFVASFLSHVYLINFFLIVSAETNQTA